MAHGFTRDEFIETRRHRARAIGPGLDLARHAQPDEPGGVVVLIVGEGNQKLRNPRTQRLALVPIPV